uniref:LAGLIDADG endonuclease n=1 Tax=Annulohypoxylon stygium TaxID=326628 RepID=V5RE01_9PEZI|nr:LAGLIDADG endonuclease [Annulohypoxylon stygium]AHB33519.1 LAGLIDADG endonuclease [Annulohypoxylon stygium]
MVFIKCSGNIEYLVKFYNSLIKLGYCKSKKPVLNKIISKKNKIIYYWKAETFYSTQFEWFYKIFYKCDIKTIPLNIKEYLTPLSLSVWYLDNTGKLYISNNQCFNLNNKNLDYIVQIFKDIYNIDIYYKLESKGKVAFYVENQSFNNFSRIIKPYIPCSLQSKLNNSHNKLTMWSNLRLSSSKSINSLMQNNIKYYSTSAKDIKYSAKYKKDYMLTDIQKEALLGIILKPLTPSRLYSTSVEDTLINNNKLLNLEGNFIAGFTDGEGCFRVRISKRNERKTGWMVEPIFQIGLHKKDLSILQLIQKTLGGIGSISSMSKEGVKFKVSSIKNLNEIIIPYFMKYPLLTSKQVDFELLKKVVDLMNQKEHLTIEGIQKFVSIKASMNLGLSEELLVAFPDVKPVLRPSTNENKIEDPNWLAGFISGEGCFL